MAKNRIPPSHPGITLFEDFMEPMNISQSQLARDLRVDPRRINEIVNGKRAISVDTARRLAKYFGTSVEFWMNLQQRYDVRLSQQDEKLNKEIELISVYESA
jgi:addiction module HigA family antidote